jgi:hypothetical protein
MIWPPSGCRSRPIAPSRSARASSRARRIGRAYVFRQRLGYGPLFGLLGVFDLVGTAALIVLIGGERHAERFAAA